MSKHPGTLRGSLFFVLAAGFLVLAVAGASAQASGPASITGTIVSVTGTSIRLSLADSSVKDVALQPTTVVLERDAATVGDLKAGEAMGVAARRDGMNLVATNINIFTAQMWNNPRMGKGQWLMDNGQTMTNAVVTDYAMGMSGHTLTMKYKDVTASITVPDGVPIHRFVAAKLAALAAGMTITVRPDPASSDLRAASISFDKPANG